MTEEKNATLPEIQDGEEKMVARLCPYCKVVSNFTRGPTPGHPGALQ